MIEARCTAARIADEVKSEDEDGIDKPRKIATTVSRGQRFFGSGWLEVAHRLETWEDPSMAEFWDRGNLLLPLSRRAKACGLALSPAGKFWC